MKRYFTILAVLALSSAVFSGTSFAVPITFTHSGMGAGSIGGNAFFSSAFTITALGNTSNVQGSLGIFVLEHDSASITIDGIGTFDFVTATRTFFNDNVDNPGFGLSSSSDLFDGPTSALLDGWDMLSSIGPIAGNMTLLQWDLLPVNTTGGVLVFESGIAAGGFEATVIPEPGTLVLVSIGLLGQIGYSRRQQRRRRKDVPHKS